MSGGNDLNHIKWVLEDRIGGLAAQLEQIERRQMHANARIRRELAGTAIMSLVALIAICMMWSGVEWRWWYALILGFGLPIYYGIEASRAMEQEEPR